MIVGIVKESFPEERRVALVPQSVATLTKAGAAVRIQAGAGEPAGFIDDQYSSAGATVLADRGEVFDTSEIICQVRAPSANPAGGDADRGMLKPGHTVIGLAEPLSERGPVETLASTGAQVFALELIPRITRAQSMDVLSSQATIAGYKAVILAAMTLPKMFPMMMTAAGTLAPARAFILGAGVAGLQAIASSRRLGAVVSAYDVRSAVKEQVESLGARFVELGLETAESQDKGGYAKAMDDSFYRRQAEMMNATVAESDVVITTAAVPGKTAPRLVSAEMVRAMQPGSVIIDLAAERGGNCELTRADETVVESGVTILGPTNIPATVPQHASQMYSRNVVSFLKNMMKDDAFVVDTDDEIVEQTLLCRGGQVVQTRVCETFGIGAAAGASSEGHG